MKGKFDIKSSPWIINRRLSSVQLEKCYILMRFAGIDVTDWLIDDHRDDKEFPYLGLHKGAVHRWMDGMITEDRRVLNGKTTLTYREVISYLKQAIKERTLKEKTF